MTIDHRVGHRSRLRKRFLLGGLDAMQDYETLELLLAYSIPRRDTKPIAKNLLDKFGTLAEVLDATVEELESVKWVSENTAILIHLIRDLCPKYLFEKSLDRDVLSSPESVIDFARMKLAGNREEKFMVIYLNTKNHVVDYKIESIGTVNQAAVYPRNIVKNALNANASGVIAVHNHPSGVCNPSSDDIKLTKIIKEATSVVNIKLIDHLIVGKSGYFSFVEEDLI